MEAFDYVDGLVKELMALRNYKKEQAEMYVLYMLAVHAQNSMTVKANIEDQMKSIRTDFAIKQSQMNAIKGNPRKVNY
jgi:hypothetical protein